MPSQAVASLWVMFCNPQGVMCPVPTGRWRMSFMPVYKHWLDYDVAALAFLIIGIAAVELIAIII